MAETSDIRHLPRHPIRVVARRTGLKADLIRAWERRYNAIEPERTVGRHRFYSDAEIERLRLLRRATGTGRSIGQIAQLSNEQLQALVEEDQGENQPEPAQKGREPLARQVLVNEANLSEPGLDTPKVPPPGAATAPRTAREDAAPLYPPNVPPTSRQLSPYFDAIHRLDGRELRNQLDRAAVELGYSRVLTEIVEPLMRQVGDRWHAGALREMHEHLATFEVRAFIEGLLRRVTAAPAAPRLVVTTPTGERHELGALLAAATACFEGWDVIYLGCDLPAQDIAAAARTVHALAVALSISYPGASPQLGHELLELRRRLADQVALLIGGRGHHELAAYLQPEAGFAPPLLVDDLGELRGVLASVRARARQIAQQNVPSAAHDFLPSPWSPVPLPAGPRPLGHRELPLARSAYRRFELDATVLSENGALRLGDLQNVRKLAQRLNLAREVAEHPQRSLRAGRVHALGLLHEVAAEILHHYRSTQNPGLLRRALAHLQKTLGETEVASALERYAELFPPNPAAFLGEAAVKKDAKADAQTGVGQPEDLLERMLLLYILARNGAAASARQLFDDHELAERSHYRRMMQRLETFLRAQPPCRDGVDLFSRLLEAQERHPESLRSQLEERLHLEPELPATLVDRMWMAIDVLREEEAPPWTRDAPPPPPRVLRFAEAPAPKRREAPWMRDLVLIAKNVKVWLAQLSASSGQKLQRLDEIPDEALAALAAAGFTGLWLVGVWQRGRASRRIKELAGRKGVLSSAYAIDRYGIADDLGGPAALARLEKKAWRHGLRLAGDMVPNHTALDSRWVIERPELFLQVQEKPFPSYSFEGEDLSSDPRVGIYLEDHYFDQSDAAVVFQRLDRKSGETRYLYHGNDGTSLPWNDTAQLDYTRPEVRELMLETLVAAAKSFPILRLDAAMTLVKEHFQRLWFPAPGKGGAVPSRAEFGMTPEAFDRRMPEELWRQVIARLEQEAPDTLLIAEGFWYLEDFFIQQLGMHRVYNSAFFHLLRDQDNKKLKANWKAVLAHDPALMHRFCNFLTNPDEKSAAESFGKGDRYFALCTLLATLPGLPLFGHNQLEGGLERYAMDLGAPELGENVDPGLVARHQKEIVPLLASRALFAGTENFRLYDFLEVPADGGEPKVLDDVFAYSNGTGKERKLVLVHNRAQTVQGRLGRTVPFRDPVAGTVKTESPEEALGQDPGPIELGPWAYRVV